MLVSRRPGGAGPRPAGPGRAWPRRAPPGGDGRGGAAPRGARPGGGGPGGAGPRGAGPGRAVPRLAPGVDLALDDLDGAVVAAIRLDQATATAGVDGAEARRRGLLPVGDRKSVV